jgi:hypothetical protein
VETLASGCQRVHLKRSTKPLGLTLVDEVRLSDCRLTRLARVDVENLVGKALDNFRPEVGQAESFGFSQCL